MGHLPHGQADPDGFLIASLGPTLHFLERSLALIARVEAL